MEQMPSWLMSIMQTGGTGAIAAVLIFAVWWITTKLNERRWDKLLAVVEQERKAAAEQSREDRREYTKSIGDVTKTLVSEIHTERERVMNAHEKDSSEDRAAMKEIAQGLTILVGQFSESKVDHVSLTNMVATQVKATERLEQAINRLGEK